MPALTLPEAGTPPSVKTKPRWAGTWLDYGWVNVTLAAILMLATLPGRTQGLGLITEPLLKELQMDRIGYAGINLWATLLGAALCFPAGYLMDRFGLRLVSAALVFLLGLTVWKMSAFAGGLAGLFVLLLLTRALGQSALSVASITAAGKATGQRLGLGMGIYSILISILFVIGFLAVGASVSASGWRIAWRQIALVLVFVVTPLTMICLREKVRLRAAPSAPLLEAETAVNLSLSAALRSRAFWVFALSAALFNLVASGLGLFNESVLAERGFNQDTYHRFLGVTTLAALIGQLVCGWLAQRRPLTALMGVGMLLYSVSLAVLPFIKTSAQLWVFAGLIGSAGGFITVIFFAVWARAFGRAHLGRIQGAAQMLTVLSSAVGPLLFAKCAEAAGSYAPLLLGLSVTVLIMAVAAWKVVLPKPALMP